MALINLMNDNNSELDRNDLELDQNGQLQQNVLKEITVNDNHLELDQNSNIHLDLHPQLQQNEHNKVAVKETNFIPFQCGSKFTSYSDFEKAKEEYENKYFAVLVKTRSEKFHDNHKHREKLMYKFVNFGCKKGLSYKQSASKGIRPNVKTGKLGCNFKLKLSASCGFLVVKECHLEHNNHELSEERYRHLPENLRLTTEEMKDAELCIKSGGNKKKIQSHLMQQRGGKPIILKTLHNIATKIQQNQQKNGQTDLEKMLDSMMTIPDAIINVAYEEETKQLIGVYFQDSRMQALFKKFPELVIFDATYKLNNYKLPLFVLLLVDGNGESEVIAFFIIQSESKICVGTMLDFFKETNASWEKIEVLVGDKDFADRVVFEEKFPSAKIQICLFHALRTFKREIPLKLGEFHIALKSQILQIFTDLAYSDSEETYNMHYSKLISLNVQDLTTYYNDNWHSIKDEWVLYEQNRNFIVKNRTSNRLESLNQKIKSVISRYSGLNKFFQDLIISVVSTNVERDHRAITMIEKVPVKIEDADDVEVKIRQNLTQFAANHVCSEYKQSRKVTFSNVNKGFYTLNKQFSVITATESSCTCGFLSSMGLPCRHIMAVRREKNLPIYVSSLSRLRWTRSYYLNSHPVFKNMKSQGHFLVTPQPKVECEKYSEVSKVTRNINSILSTLPNDKYNYYLEKLKDFENLLSTDKSIFISEHLKNNVDQQELNPLLTVGLGENQEIVEQQQLDTSSTDVQMPSTSINLSSIKLIKPIKKHGNAKGFGQTVIGLNRGRKKKMSHVFQNKPEQERLIKRPFIINIDNNN